MKTKAFRALEREAGHEIRAAVAHNVWDPVCGMFLIQSALRFTYEGQSFPLCGFPCASRFREDPERFLRAASRDDARSRK